jgi:hypothetical protein
MQQEYEDERLGEHAKELLAKLNDELGGAAANGDEDEENGEEWEDDENEESDEDEEMVES